MLPCANFALGAAGAAAAPTGLVSVAVSVNIQRIMQPEVLLAILAGLGNAWVLLIEILR